MQISLSIDSQVSIDINHSNLANFVCWLDDEEKYAEFFSRLAGHPAAEVRSAVAIKSFLSHEALQQLARDSSVEVVHQVANNEKAMEMFDVSLIMEMIARDVSVAVDIANSLPTIRQYIRDEVAYVLSKHTDPKVLDALGQFDCAHL